MFDDAEKARKTTEELNRAKEALDDAYYAWMELQ